MLSPLLRQDKLRTYNCQHIRGHNSKKRSVQLISKRSSSPFGCLLGETLRVKVEIIDMTTQITLILMSKKGNRGGKKGKGTESWSLPTLQPYIRFIRILLQQDLFIIQTFTRVLVTLRSKYDQSLSQIGLRIQVSFNHVHCNSALQILASITTLETRIGL